jgi:hypothetical protein
MCVHDVGTKIQAPGTELAAVAREISAINREAGATTDPHGRKLKLTVHQQQEALARRAAGEALGRYCAKLRGEPFDYIEARVMKWARREHASQPIWP